MLHKAKTEPEANFSVDRTSNTIRLARDFDASPAKIFQAWTQPEHVSHWWDTTGDRLTHCEIDLRPGGQFKFVSKGNPEMPFSGTYREIAPPFRLIFEAMGAVGRVQLSPLGSGTRMAVEIECSSAEHLEQFVQRGIPYGTSVTMDNLVGYAKTAFQSEQL